MSYDAHDDILQVVGNSRYLYNTNRNKTNQIRIYRQSSATVFKNPSGYYLDRTIDRPMPNSHWFYWYPKRISLNQNEQLYIISYAKMHDSLTEGSHLKNEDSKLFIFKIKRTPN